MSIRIIVVDQNDMPLGMEERELARERGLTWRASGLWIVNKRNQVLLAQRSPQKLHGAGQWSFSVAGTVEEGETYDSNVRKEAEEELGLVDIEPVRGPKMFLSHLDKSGVFAQLYFLEMDRPPEAFHLNKQEVAEVRWFSNAQISEHLAGDDPDWEYVRRNWKDWFSVLRERGYLSE